MLIDCSYFTKGSRHILNASVAALPNANAMEVNEAIEAYIAERQEQYLAKALGMELGNRVNAYLVCMDEDDGTKAVERYDSICERLREPFADYVFFQMLRDANSQCTATGLVRLKCANEYVAPIQRQVNAWNSMVDKHRLIAEWLESVGGAGISTDFLTKINVMNL